MGKSEQQEIRELWDQASKKRDEEIRDETMEWVGNSVRRDLEGILERRENRMRELVGDDVRRLLEEWGKKMEGVWSLGGRDGREQEKETGGLRELVVEDVRKVLEEWEKRLEGKRDLRRHGGKEQEKEKETGREKVSDRRVETAKVRDVERLVVRGA